MSQQNLEIVRRMYALWSGRDWEAMVELVDPDVEQHGTVGGLGEGHISRGVEIEIDTASVFDVRGGRIVRIQPYMNPVAALESVGLSEQDAQM